MSTSATNPTSVTHVGIKHARSNSNSSTEHPSKSTQQQPAQAHKRQLLATVEMSVHELNTASRDDSAPMTPATAAKPEKQGQWPQQRLSSTLDDANVSGLEARTRSSEAKKQKQDGALITPERQVATSGNRSSAKRSSRAMDASLRMEGTMEHEQHEQREHDRPKKKTKGDREKQSDELKVPIKPKEPKEPRTSTQTIPSSRPTDSKDPTQSQKPREGSDGQEPGSATQHEIKRPKADITTLSELSEEDRYFVMHPDSIVGNIGLKNIITYQTYCAMPSSTQDAFASLLPTEVFLDERLSMQKEVGTRRLTEAFFKSEYWLEAIESWVEGLQLGLQSVSYQEVKQQMTAIAEDEDQWKSEAYEEYYGEHAYRETESKLTASGSAKMSTAHMGRLGGIRVGDQLRYQRQFKVPVTEPEPVHQERDGNEAKDGQGRSRRVAKSTPRPSAKRERSVHVDMRLRVLGFKKDGTPIVQFVETRAPADAEEPESAYQERLARSKDIKNGHDFVSALDLEQLCLESDGQVPEPMRVPRQRKGSAARPQNGAEEAWKDIDVIRGTVRVGSVFGIRMDLWKQEKNVQSRKAELESALLGEEAESSSRKKAKGKGKKVH